MIVFLLNWLGRLFWGKEQWEEFERKQRQPKPMRRQPIRAKRKRR